MQPWAGIISILSPGTTTTDSAAPHVHTQPIAADESIRAALRLGAYQLIFLGMAHHAAVGATAGAVPPKTRGFVNAVLRRVADAGHPEQWPSAGVRLSYPDWIIEWATRELGDDAQVLADHGLPDLAHGNLDTIVVPDLHLGQAAQVDRAVDGARSPQHPAARHVERDGADRRRQRWSVSMRC